MDNKFQIQLKVNNLGPHFGEQSIEFEQEVETNKAVFYASNGIGKTFISRAFRLAEIVPDDFDASKILSMDTTEGSLSFSIVSNHETKELAVNVKSWGKPIINNSLGFKFHVFNSDFVEENIKAKRYSPDGNIDGYILGKIQIDLSKERSVETEIKKKIELLNQDIDNQISQARDVLQREGVQATTTEMRLLSREKVKIPENQKTTDSFDQIVEKLTKLKNVPEKLADVSLCAYSTSVDVLSNAIDLLTTEYPKSDWDEEFVSSFEKKRAFIEKGLQHSPNDNQCPFCGRTYDDDSLALIRHYRAYLADKQTQVLKQISDCKEDIQATKKEIEKFIDENKVSAGELSEISRFFPSLKKEKIVIPEINPAFLSLLADIKDLLDKKADNLSNTFEENAQWKKHWNKQKNALVAISKENAEVVRRVNKIKNNANGERLSLRRELCIAKYNEVCKSCAGALSELNASKEKLKKLQESIREKEQLAKVSKKDKVFDTLTHLLNRFFYEKYTIDRNSFELQFHGKKLGKNVENVLSDGEKGIIAFCLYLSYIHQLIETEDDYEKLFFVIDDPISSMDFNYVYVVAQTLREIKELFGIRSHERIWVFTHNIEFLSIIARNHVLPNVYLLTPGNITKYDYNLLMPYESHLHDVVCIADGKMDPSHTTGNSIRHIIETIAKFEDPQTGIYKYIQSNEILSNNSAMFLLCQDLSHGNMRSESPYTPEIMKSACQAVKKFIESKYPMQIVNVKE